MRFFYLFAILGLLLSTASQAQPTKAPTTSPAIETLKDCPDCPEMVAIPAGSFMMGSPAKEFGRKSDESPQHRVTIQKFALAKTETTFAQWDACVADGGCNGYRPSDQKWGRGNRPVINVSWEQAQNYIKWLNAKTGKTYILPTEAQWEYAARAGTTTPFHTGECISTTQANFNGEYDYDNCGGKTDVYKKQTLPVASFAANQFGLHDMVGNVWEWTQDCWNDSYKGAPTDGSAALSGKCGLRVLRGGGWYFIPQFSRSARRDNDEVKNSDENNGFRVARLMP